MSSRVQSTRTGISDMGRMAQEGEAQRIAKQKMTAEAHSLLYKERERLRQEAEDSDCSSSYQTSGYHRTYNGSPISSLYSSRKSSADHSYSTNNSNDPRELRRQISMLEDRLKEVLVLNGQLDCDKQHLSYCVDLLKDKLEDFTESNHTNQKSLIERKRELAYQRMQITELTNQLENARKLIEVRDQLIAERGLIVVDATDLDSPTTAEDEKANPSARKKVTNTSVAWGSKAPKHLVNGASSCAGAANDPDQSKINPSSFTILSRSNADALKFVSGYSMDDKLASLFEERSKNLEQIDTLKKHLAEEREMVVQVQKIESRVKGGDPADVRQSLHTARSQAQDFKFRWEQAAQRVTSLEGDIIRLEAQLKRYKTISESCEQQEEALKTDRRKFQRDLREAMSKIADLTSENNTLQRKIDKLSRGPGSSNLRSYRDSSQAL